ncbi:radical SAM family heme chaperone HemW [Thiocystis violacea]|uniref:radical SAM family heme chaperone HemW n=1 Tax=Thiocystis violacea TaxID=13725 RepID=UPI001908CCE5|nr:radical SAM family heme chaperone HemW [Thiocystis violacea]MBK1717406.1 YggW family oxidoreductase [Thiocystis violacea]
MRHASESPGASSISREPAPLPPLTLYIHTPWCARKCPYCDFNSHAGAGAPPFEPYVTQLLADLEMELRSPAARRPLRSIFIGGGTPSLFPGAAIRRLLDGVRARVELHPQAEITLEANPGTVDSRHFAAYREAGVNRLSIGVQSLSADSLEWLGRIHGPDEARAALRIARELGFDNINLDLMFALPGQTLEAARADLEALIALAPEHISYYQLTLEPNTLFHAQPPERPDVDLTADMGFAGAERLEAAGYGRYEVSAYAQADRQCRHNLNYWRFGDYLGLGAGAHGKLTQRGTEGAPWRIWRSEKPSDPKVYLGADPKAPIGSRQALSASDTILELALNALRLTDGFEPALFTATTGLPWSRIAPYLEAAVEDGLLILTEDVVKPTPLGQDFLDDLIARFLPLARESPDRP